MKFSWKLAVFLCFFALFDIPRSLLVFPSANLFVKSLRFEKLLYFKSNLVAGFLFCSILSWMVRGFRDLCASKPHLYFSTPLLTRAKALRSPSIYIPCLSSLCVSPSYIVFVLLFLLFLDQWFSFFHFIVLFAVSLFTLVPVLLL